MLVLSRKQVKEFDRGYVTVTIVRIGPNKRAIGDRGSARFEHRSRRTLLAMRPLLERARRARPADD